MKSRFKTFVNISSVIVFIIVLHYIDWLRPIENFLRSLIRPGSDLVYEISLTIGDQTENFADPEELQQSYKKLKEDFNNQKTDQAKMQILLDENEELKRQLNFVSQTSFHTIGANVIGKNIDPLGNTIIINIGKNQNVKIDDPVIVGNGILIGKIAKTEDRISVVRLINDNQSKIAVSILNSDKSLGLVEGGYGISVRMNYIPQNESINIGDTIITSGLEENIPKGLLIGTIEAVEKEAYQPFQKAILTPMVNLEKISLVSVITTE